MTLLNKAYIISFLLFTCNFYEGFAQQNLNFVYKEVPEEIKKEFVEDFKNIFIPSDAIYIEEVRGGVPKDSKRATSVIQSALDKNRIVVLPNRKINISKEGLKLRSNSILFFQEATQLLMEGNSLDYYQMLKIHNVENVKVYNANIQGDRGSHKGVSGEWGYGISIRSSSNVVIENARVSDFWGDGIAIGYSTTSTNKNITLSNIFIDNNRRNGISIMNVKDLIMENILISNTNGTLPMFGIDIEPNNSNDIINNITMNNIMTYNNHRGGIMITFNKMLSKLKKNISVKINRFRDVGSLEGLFLAGIPKKAIGLEGNVIIKNVVLEENTRPIRGRVINNENVLFKIENLKVIRPKNKNYTHQEIDRVFQTMKNYSIGFGS